MLLCLLLLALLQVGASLRKLKTCSAFVRRRPSLVPLFPCCGTVAAVHADLAGAALLELVVGRCREVQLAVRTCGNSWSPLVR